MTDTELPLPPWRRGLPKRARPARPALGQAQIVDAGLRIVTEEGVEAVSMRRIAAVFHTGASSLYAHVANKEELLQLMFDRICGDIDVPAPEPGRWRDQIRQLARSSHAVMGRYNDIARAALATVPTGPNALRVSEGMLAILLAGGVPPKVASWALDRLFLYLVADSYEGSLHAQAAAGRGVTEGEYGDTFAEQLAGYFENLPAERFPNLRANARVMTSGGQDERFEFGLDLIIDGVARYARS
ncbi:TetR/AcrR family transcriptional regulator [Actinoplanes sp. NPDC051475]|uniref:TetR/AcrR family transcriptional regulator n=1 Tax=Actinoplanes sp. NPDC051475 TaxID=3157225 RepID=UPI00344E317F